MLLKVFSLKIIKTWDCLVKKTVLSDLPFHILTQLSSPEEIRTVPITFQHTRQTCRSITHGYSYTHIMLNKRIPYFHNPAIYECALETFEL